MHVQLGYESSRHRQAVQKITWRSTPICDVEVWTQHNRQSSDEGPLSYPKIMTDFEKCLIVEILEVFGLEQATPRIPLSPSRVFSVVLSRGSPAGDSHLFCAQARAPMNCQRNPWHRLLILNGPASAPYASGALFIAQSCSSRPNRTTPTFEPWRTLSA